MSKKNFIPLCMIPFIANMMGGKQDESSEEPELPYYILKKLDFCMSLFRLPSDPQQEGGPEFAVGVTASPALLSAIMKKKDILFPADFDESYMVPEGVTDDNVDAYIESLYEAKREEYPYLIESESNDFMHGFVTLIDNKPEGDALWLAGTAEALTYGFDGVQCYWTWRENAEDGQHFITYEDR